MLRLTDNQPPFPRVEITWLNGCTLQMSRRRGRSRAGGGIMHSSGFYMQYVAGAVWCLRGRPTLSQHFEANRRRRFQFFDNQLSGFSAIPSLGWL